MPNASRPIPPAHLALLVRHLLATGEGELTGDPAFARGRRPGAPPSPANGSCDLSRCLAHHPHPCAEPCEVWQTVVHLAGLEDGGAMPSVSALLDDLRVKCRGAEPPALPL